MVAVPKPTKKPKAQTIQGLMKRLWRAFSKWVRWRDGYICYTCGKDMRLKRESAQAGHYIPQSKGNALRFDERNVHCQCVTCNSFNSGNLSAYALRLTREYGPNILEEFDRIKNARRKYTRQELMEMIADYEGRVKNIELMESFQ